MRVVESDSLSELLARARELLHREGVRHGTQRGATRTLNLVTLHWLPPHQLGEVALLPWSAADAEEYLRIFVEKSPGTDPLRPVKAGELVFPYTYAARSRYWDGGWAYLTVLLGALDAWEREQGTSLALAAASCDRFAEVVAVLSEALHVQTVLSLLSLYGPQLLADYRARGTLVEQTAHAWRRDTLEAAIADVRLTAHSRRAVVPSFAYPHLEGQLQPEMGKPAYQMFQLLPDDADGPVSSVHEHRSLDVVGGAQLDLLHDLSWLRLASERLDRPMGTISVVAHNLHEYEPTENVLPDSAPTLAQPEETAIARWLCRVTDGYRTGRGTARALLDQPVYAENLRRIYARWQTFR